jgi:hypothetical protein
MGARPAACGQAEQLVVLVVLEQVDEMMYRSFVSV